MVPQEAKVVLRWLGVVVATLTGNTFLVVGSIVLGSATIVGGLLNPSGKIPDRCARLWARGLLWFSGAKVRCTFEGSIPPEQPHVYLANHQSLYDIPLILATLPGRARFLAKRSLFLIPVFGWALRVAGFVPVDRSNRARARESFEESVSLLDRGMSVVIFPEETRSQTSELLEFKGGGFLLALKADVAIVPVGLRGTLDMRPRGSLLVRPGELSIGYGAAQKLGSVRKKREQIENVRAEIDRLMRSAR